MFIDFKKLSYKKIIGLCLIFITLVIVIFSPSMSSLYKNCPCSKIRNKNIRNFVLKNKSKFDKYCLTKINNYSYYNTIYKTTIKTIDNLENNKYIRKEDKRELFNLLKGGKLYELKNKLKVVALNKIDSNSLSKKFFIDGLLSELLFNDKEAEKFYLKAIETNKFDGDFYFYLAKFYQKNCNYKKAIDILLSVVSVLNNNNDRNNFNSFYCLLGDLYFDIRDYNNAIIYYTNSFVNTDITNKDYNKFSIIVKIGDIMMARGNSFEAINNYKYALGLKTRRVSKDDEIKLLLKLSSAYYKYGNYENGLKFAKSASIKSKKIRNKLLYSKAKYNECLNYEFLQDNEKAKKSCSVALYNAEKYNIENNDVFGYINIADMLDYSVFVRNSKLAKNYLEKALELDSNILNEIVILERLLGVDAYSSNNFEDFFKNHKRLQKIYRKTGVDVGCCTDILKAFVKERSGKGGVDKDYLFAVDKSKYNYSQLCTIYTYLSDYYKKNGKFKDALFYANKALKTASYIYRYDHHYIKYFSERVDNIKNTMKQKH